MNLTLDQLWLKVGRDIGTTLNEHKLDVGRYIGTTLNEHSFDVVVKLEFHSRIISRVQCCNRWSTDAALKNDKDDISISVVVVDETASIESDGMRKKLESMNRWWRRRWRSIFWLFVRKDSLRNFLCVRNQCDQIWRNSTALSNILKGFDNIFNGIWFWTVFN